MMYHMSYVQYATTAIVSLNRLTILYDHITFEKLWRKYSAILMLFVYLLPFISTGRLLTSTCTWGTRLDDTYVLSCNLPTTILFLPLIIFQIICLICSLVCNLASVVIVFRASEELKGKMELNFIILISVTTVVQFFGTFISIILSFYSDQPFYRFFHTFILPFISDLFTIMHPWLLFALCKPIRSHIMQDFCKMKSNTVGVVPRNSNTPHDQHRHSRSNQTGSRISMH